jgi:hypothetical protein
MVEDQGIPDDVSMWLASSGRFDDAVRYAELFWPAFAEIDGCVFLGARVPETYGEWKARLGADHAAIESVLNHRHILELFLRAPDPSREVTRHLGQTMQDMWAAKLQRDFPDRRFVVTLSDDDDPEITFYTERRDG